jgi:O-antigen ligase
VKSLWFYITMPGILKTGSAQVFAGLIASVLIIMFWLLFSNVSQFAMLLIVACAIFPLWIMIKYPILAGMLSAFVITSNLSFYYERLPLLVMSLSIFICLFRKIAQQKFTWRYSNFVIWSGLLFIWQIVTILWLTRYDYMGFGIQLYSFPIMILFTELADSTDSFKALFVAAMLGALASGLYVIVQMIMPFVSGYVAQGAWAIREVSRARYFGNWSRPTVMAYSMMTVITMCLAMLHHSVSRWIRILSVFTICVMLISIFVSLTRGALIATAILFFVFIGYAKSRFRIAISLAIAAVIIVAILPVDVFSRFTNLAHGQADQSLDERRILRNSGLDLAVEAFPFGSGIGSFYAYSSTRLIHLGHAIGSHNSYIDIIAETGVVGTFLFCFMIISLWNASSLSLKVGISDSGFTRNIGAAGRAGLIAILLCMLVENRIGFQPFWLFFTLLSSAPHLSYKHGYDLNLKSARL